MTMRYLMKGGYWKNSEDEILKAAVMKYGLNQWSRISSLLARKSAKQCKARWYEWLDPSIKKTEWTREEEEKLLHLAKIFPSQWRTIAPIVGRTPAQCVEHYERLLDQAQGRDEIDENDPRKLKPGEIDPTPEIRPARADAKDMDDDEKEMIAETRVRLANIKGKKAKRRAREKFIEKTRQLAQLQKQRELRAAGIEYVIEKKKKKKKIEIDYNAEIPFEHRPTDNVYVTGAQEEPAPNIDMGNISLNTIEGVRRDEEEKRLRKLDQKKLKKLRSLNLPEHIDKLNKTNPLLYQKKTRLVLSEPQLTDKDLELLGKMTKNAADLITVTQNQVTRELVGNYSIREPTPVKTPKYSSQLMKEARHAYNLMNAQSPLLGPGNYLSEEPGSDAGKKSGRTPNPYKKIISENFGQSRGETPLSATSKAKVPDKASLQGLYRDELNLNNDEWADSDWEQGSQFAFEGGSAVNRFDKIREIIRRSLEAIPAPRNDYEVEMPEVEEFYRREQELVGRSARQLDLEDLEELRRDAQDRERRRDFFKKSQVRQKQLPIPHRLPEDYRKSLNLSSSSTRNADPKTLVEREMAQLIVNDIVEASNRKHDVGEILAYYDQHHDNSTDPDELEKAEFLVEEETRKMCGELGASQELVEGRFLEQLGKRPAEPSEPEKQAMLPELLRVEESLRRQVDRLEAEIEEARDAEQERLVESEIKLLGQELEVKRIELDVYERLQEQENHSIIHRLHEADVFIHQLKQKEAVLQALYKKYQDDFSN